MRTEDLNQLEEPYRSSGLQPEQRLAQALGLVLPSVADLFKAIDADRDVQIYGIGWWAPHPGTSRRILISDHLIQCVASIPKNLTEAKLHLLESSDYWQRESNFLSNGAGVDRRGKVILPPRLKPADDLPHAMASLHVAGFFRAILAALDCLGTAIIGTLGLPTSIIKGDLAVARSLLARTKNGSSCLGASVQADFSATLDGLVADAGPDGWLEWTMAFRHMLVHRARRLEFSQLRPHPTIFGPDGNPIIRVESIHHLSRDPQLSDIEALLNRQPRDLVLNERAERTLMGVLSSIVKLVDGTARHLLGVWEKRRANPALILQPREQWPNVPSSPLSAFLGYAPPSVSVDPTANVDPKTFITAPDTWKRLLSSAVDDDQRGKWQHFD
jgi:hypothetical protein